MLEFELTNINEGRKALPKLSDYNNKYTVMSNAAWMQEFFDSVQIRASWDNDDEYIIICKNLPEANKIMDIMKERPAYTHVRLKLDSCYRQCITFIYHKERDKDRLNKAIEEDNRLKAEQAKFEEDVNNSDTSLYTPTERDWIKMLEYMNRGSLPARVVSSCKDNNKIIARYLIASAIGWSEVESLFKDEIVKNKKILSAPELEAYRRRYSQNIPEEYQEMINDYKQYDTKGKIAQKEKSDFGEFANASKILEALDNNDKVIDYSFYKANQSSSADNIRLIRITLSNGVTTNILLQHQDWGPMTTRWKVGSWMKNRITGVIAWHVNTSSSATYARYDILAAIENAYRLDPNHDEYLPYKNYFT